MCVMLTGTCKTGAFRKRQRSQTFKLEMMPRLRNLPHLAWVNRRTRVITRNLGGITQETSHSAANSAQRKLFRAAVELP